MGEPPYSAARPIRARVNRGRSLISVLVVNVATFHVDTADREERPLSSRRSGDGSGSAAAVVALASFPFR
jgi:hypothetical protein